MDAHALPDIVPPILCGVLVILIVLGIISYQLTQYRERKRREAFRAVAAQLGFSFYAARDFRIAGRYHYLDALHQGTNRHVFNRIEGMYRGYPVTAFDFHYEIVTRDRKGRKCERVHEFTYFMLLLERPFSELLIYPEGLWGKLGQALGYDDIDFESREFSRTFTVRAKDRQFAYDICHARMMEHLLSDPTLAIEIEGTCLGLGAKRRIDPEQIVAQLDRLIAVRELFPRYLFDSSVGRHP